MEFPKVKAAAPGLLRSGPQGAYLDFSHHARQSVSRPGRIGVNQQLSIEVIDGEVGMKIVKCLGPRPALDLKSSVHHQSDRAQGLCRSRVQLCRFISVHTQGFSQRSGVQAPAFREGRFGAETAESRQIRAFLLERRLEMLARERSL